jgi:hypothetical protein
LVLGGLFGWRAAAWLVTAALVVLGFGLPAVGSLSWPFALLGLAVGCALSLLPYRAFIAAALCAASALVGGLFAPVLIATLVCVVASSIPTLAHRSSTAVVLGPLLAVAVTAGSELILWSEVTFGGQQGGVLFGSGYVTVPLLVTACVFSAALGLLDI